MTRLVPSAVVLPLGVLLALPFAGCTGAPAECPAIAFICDEGFEPADTDGDGCEDECVAVQCAAQPVCDAGHEEVADESACLQDDAVCYSREACGTTIWCTGPVPAETACLADEECGPSQACDTVHYCDSAPGCGQNGDCLAVCYGRCVEVAQCEAYPVCDEGDTQVDGESSCLQDDAVCYSRALCGTTIWCTGPSDAPQACLVDEECGDTAVCDTVTYCDAAPECDGDEGCLAVCYGRCVEAVACLAYPVCDAGHDEVANESACLQDDAVCYERSICGISIWCTGPA